MAGETKLAVGPLPEPERLLGIDLLRVLEQAPLRRREWTPLWALGQGPVPELLQRRGRVLFRVREQTPAQALVQVREQRPARGPGMRPGQGLVQ